MPGMPNTPSVLAPHAADDANTTADNLAALLAFYDRYPEYRNRTLFLAGESYSGAAPRPMCLSVPVADQALQPVLCWRPAGGVCDCRCVFFMEW